VGNGHEYTLTFREDDVRYIMQSLRDRKSCILVGVDGVGKSSLVRHLLTASVREYYLNEEKENILILALDAHELAKPSALAYYRRMASLLESIILKNDDGPGVENVLAVTSEEVAKQLLFERVETLLAQNEQRKLVFLLDEFHIAFIEVEQHFFRVLQALRSRTDRRVHYIAVSRNVPSLICDARTHKIVRDMFSELFNGNVRGIAPFQKRDAYEALRREMTRRGCTYPPVLQDLLLEVTGNHPGLLKAVVTAYATREGRLSEQDSKALLIEKLLKDGVVLDRCQQIWNSLSEIEQACLRQMHRGVIPKAFLDLQQYGTRQFNEALHYLVLKGILVEKGRSDGSYHCFSPLFAAYIEEEISRIEPGLRLDPARREVWIDGVLRASNLTAKEFKLLRFLVEHMGEVCSRQETTRAVYGEEYDPKRDDARLDALVERTRKSIGDTSRPPRFIETVRGAGHRLNDYPVGHKER
jgi:DNA-binding winged helix-turn-helix (wHTH) protein